MSAMETSFSVSMKIPYKVTRLAVVGAGYVGGPTAAVIAKHCPHLRVTVTDVNKDRIAQWNSLELPFYEPGLKEIVLEVINKNLFFSSDVEKEIGTADMVMVAVNTPTKETEKGPQGYDLTAYEAVARTIAKSAKNSLIVVEKSTVPVRTAERMRMIFEANKTSENVHFEVVSNPEFLAEGTAMKNLEHPDRVLIGGMENESGSSAAAALAEIYAWWVPAAKILKTNLWSSELAKLAANAFLAQRVSSINAIAALCEECGANVKEVSRVLGADERIGKYFLNASVGFGGSCFGKDLQGLIYLCENYHLNTEADYWRQVLAVNQHQKSRFVKRVVNTLFGTVKNKCIGVLGYAFKKDTSDVRESPAIDIVNGLLAERAIVKVYDPKAASAEIKQYSPGAVVCKSAEEASLDSHALLILTEWDELDYRHLFSRMHRPAHIFDGRSVLLQQRHLLKSIGFQVYSVGLSDSCLPPAAASSATTSASVSYSLTASQQGKLTINSS